MKTTHSHISQGLCEQRPWHTRFIMREFGKTRLHIDCPFCGGLVVAYLWSLAGGGKRCDCGAMIGHYGTAYKVKDE